MSKTKTYIELNGATYDASTGRVVAPAGPKPAASTSVKAAAPGHAIDGVVRRSSNPSHIEPKTPAGATRRTVNHRRAQPAHRKAQRSGTLMRQAVHKPAINSLFHAKAVPLTSSGATVALEAGWPAAKPQRTSRAQTVAKSGLISKFGSGKLFVRLGHVPVAKPPKGQPSAAQRKNRPVRPNPFHKALEQATSHQQPKIKKVRAHHRLARKLHLSQRVFNVSAGVLAALILGGFILYQNLPNLNVRLAAARAGFHASLPGYHPAGFSLKGPIHYAPGELSFNFQSNSDDRNFQVKQQASNWNDATLLQTYVSKQPEPYQTYEGNGRTVYISSRGANLVTGNKWIQVQSDGSLSTEQLLNIVKSIN